MPHLTFVLKGCHFCVPIGQVAMTQLTQTQQLRLSSKLVTVGTYGLKQQQNNDDDDDDDDDGDDDYKPRAACATLSREKKNQE